MLARTLSRLTILFSIAIFAGVTYYFMNAYRSLRERERVITTLRQVGNDDGPCAALQASRAITQVLDEDVRYTIDGMRSAFAAQIVGVDDRRGRKALLSAHEQGLVDGSLCEQIRLATATGEVHPVLALLRYTREGGSACEEESVLSVVLDGLGSHRGQLLHALMREVEALRCLSPAVAEKVATGVMDTLESDPAMMDDLDTLHVASFLDAWVPLRAAQFGCRVVARGEKSRLGGLLGCTPDQKERVLIHYRTLVDSTAEGRPVLPAKSEVILLSRSADVCEVMPQAGQGTYTLPCDKLALASDLHLAVRIEALSYGRAEADLIAGLVSYAGEQGKLIAASKQSPELRAWFAYDRDGALLGNAHTTELSAVAAVLGEEVPDRPLRAFCKRAGARYCYDVDWAHVVSRLAGESVLFLSKPASVFLQPKDLEPPVALRTFIEAFRRAPLPNTFWRVYPLRGQGLLVVESERDNIELRWQHKPGSAWKSQSFGRSRGGPAPGAARLLATLDLERDGQPELVVQELQREPSPDGPRDASDAVSILHLEPKSDRFAALNQLTIHEY